MEEEKVAEDKVVGTNLIIPLFEVMDVYNMACSITVPKVRYQIGPNSEEIMAKEVISNSILIAYAIVDKVYKWTKLTQEEENKGGDEKSVLP
jgi:hypothetical protein